MTKEVSIKSKKSDILDAYENLLKQVRKEKQVNPQEEKEKQQNKSLIETVSKHTPKNMIGSIAELKILIGNNLDLLEQKLLEEYRKLNDLQESIKIESKNIEELYGIKKNSDSLATLILAQKNLKDEFELEIKNKKEEFDEEMEETKKSWRKKKEEMEKEYKELQQINETRKRREEEEYNYNLQLARKKDQDTYEERMGNLEKDLLDKKIKFEKESSEREKLLSEKEKEFEDLQQQVTMFPDKINEVIGKTEEKTRNEMEKKFNYDINLASREQEGEMKLKQQIIESLKNRINEQDKLIDELTKKASVANSQVQSIALKAVEGASLIRYEENKKKGTQNTNV
jgi:hypothetical protein